MYWGIPSFSARATGSTSPRTMFFTIDSGEKPMIKGPSTVTLTGDWAAPYKHLLVAPNFLRSGFVELIDKEIENAKSGNKASIIIKLNSLEDRELIDKLYEASQAGVKVSIIVRGICCLIPGVKGMSENITVRSIVGRFLEHARVYIFNNEGEEKMYVASADWMKRNLSRRVEVAFPVLDEELKVRIKSIIDLQLGDNEKSRKINKSQSNPYITVKGKKINAQEDVYGILKSYEMSHF